MFPNRHSYRLQTRGAGACRMDPPRKNRKRQVGCGSRRPPYNAKKKSPRISAQAQTIQTYSITWIQPSGASISHA